MKHFDLPFAVGAFLSFGVCAFILAFLVNVEVAVFASVVGSFLLAWRSMKHIESVAGLLGALLCIGYAMLIGVM